MKKYLLILSAFFFLTISHTALQGEESNQLEKSFEHWLKHTISELNSHSHVIETAKGPIEYRKFGEGPIVLCLHGAPGGYDQSFLIGSQLLRHGFSILGVSRPGYLRTPLSTGASHEEQADALAALLDALGISQAAVLGFSAGGPVAFEFALRHPERTWALVLESIGALPSDSAMYNLLVGLIKIEPLADLGGWLFSLSLKHRWSSTAKLILSLDNTLSLHSLHGRIHYVLDHQRQSRFLKRLMFSVLPFSPRTEGFINDISNINPWPFYPYDQIVTPTIIIQAINDDNGSYPEALFAAQNIPGAKLISVHGSGHFVWLGKHTQKWEEQLSEFLKKHKP